MLCCEIAKRRSGRRGVRLGRCGASRLCNPRLVRLAGDQFFTSKHWPLDRVVCTQCMRIGTTTTTRSAQSCSTSVGEQRGPKHIDHIQPPFGRGGLLGRALVRSTNYTSARRSRKIVITSRRTRWASRKESRSTRGRFRRESPWPRVLTASPISSAGDPPAKEAPTTSVRRTPMGWCSEGRAVWLWAWHVGLPQCHRGHCTAKAAIRG